MILNSPIRYCRHFSTYSILLLNVTSIPPPRHQLHLPIIGSQSVKCQKEQVIVILLSDPLVNPLQRRDALHVAHINRLEVLQHNFFSDELLPDYAG